MSYYEATKSTVNKSKWTIRLVTDKGPNVVYGYYTFTSKKTAQGWADRLNRATGERR